MVSADPENPTSLSKREAKAISKRERLEWGATHAKIQSFSCHPLGNSELLVPMILLTFRRGNGFFIHPYCFSSDVSGVDADRALFRERLGRQIEELIGVAPRFEKDDRGMYWVFYD
jgi:hypothetical protein